MVGFLFFRMSFQPKLLLYMYRMALDVLQIKTSSCVIFVPEINLEVSHCYVRSVDLYLCTYLSVNLLT